MKVGQLSRGLLAILNLDSQRDGEAGLTVGGAIIITTAFYKVKRSLQTNITYVWKPIVVLEFTWGHYKPGMNFILS